MTLQNTDERLVLSQNPHWRGERHPHEKIFDRDIQKTVFEYLDTKQILCLLGPRRTGKTTILRSVISKLLSEKVPPKQIFYFSFDELMSTDHNFLDELLSFYFERISEDKNGKCYILLDEIHNIDFWQTILKRHYDNLHPKAKFIVTGSSSVWLKRKSRESLAGRARDFVVHPLSFREFLVFSGLEIPQTSIPETFADIGKFRKSLIVSEDEIIRSFDKYLLKGGFPEIVAENMSFEAARNYIWSQVVEKTVLRDLALYFPVDNPKVIIEILRILSWQSSGLFELKNLANTLNLNAATVSKYLSYLEIGYLLGFSYNYTKSRVKQVRSLKKVYLADTGLMTSIAMLGEDTLAHPDETGRIVETAVRNHFAKNAECYFWRDEHKNELDLVARFSESLLPIEVKYTDKLSKSDMKTLTSFMNKYSIKKGVVATKSILEDYGDIWAVPAWLLMLVDWNRVR